MPCKEAEPPEQPLVVLALPTVIAPGETGNTSATVIPVRFPGLPAGLPKVMDKVVVPEALIVEVPKTLVTVGVA